MKKCFSVGFTIHEALNLVREKGRPIDPLVVVRCCGREYRSEIKFSKANVVSWDESYTWTDLELTSDVSVIGRTKRYDYCPLCLQPRHMLFEGA